MKKAKKVLWIGFGILALAIIIFAGITVNSGTKNKDLDRGSEITSPGQITMSIEEQNVTIVTPGEYIIVGDSDNKSILIDADGEVDLVLNNTTLDVNSAPAIINLTDNPVVIALVDNTTNTLVGGGGEYNAVIYSKGEITIVGELGNLVVGSRGEIDTAIQTENDKKITFEGGTIVTLDLIDWSEFNVLKKSLAFDFGQKVKRGSKISIKDSENNEVCNFKTEVEFEKMTVSSSKFASGIYSVYSGQKLIGTEEVAE